MVPMEDIQRTTNRDRDYRTWSGTSDELRRLAVIVGELLKDVDAGDFLVTFRYVDGPESAEGPWESVLREMDLRRVSEINLTGKLSDPSKDEDKIGIEFRFDQERPAVRLEVNSSNPGWGRQAFVRLDDEISRGVRKWDFVHSKVGVGVFGWVSLIASIISVRALYFVTPGPTQFSTKAGDPTNAKGVFHVVTVVALIVLFSWGHHKLRRWVFPPLEITRSEAAGVGARRIAYFGALLLQIALGVFVNRIS